jgi:hypothetical protein
MTSTRKTLISLAAALMLALAFTTQAADARPMPNCIPGVSC